MTYSIQSPFRSSPRVSESRFVGILRNAGALASIPLWRGLSDRFTTTEQAARAIYQYIASHGHDPAVFLAICAREHRYGLDKNSVLWRSDTRSLTNARTVRDPALMGSAVVIIDPVRKSGYVKYQNVLDSVQDGIYRVDDPTYAYAGKTTLAEIFSVWTEDPAEYAAFVADWLNTNADMEGTAPMAGDDSRFDWAPETAGEFGYPTGTRGRSGKPIELLILHITAGTDSLDWLRAGHGSSTHYLTDRAGKPRAQMIAESDAAWTAGNRDRNERGINVEVEMLRVSDWTDAILKEVARTVAPIMARNNIPAVYLGRDNDQGKRGMIGHRDVPDPNDPSKFGGSTHHDDPGASFPWDTFVKYVAAEMGTATPTPPVDDAWRIPGNPFGDYGWQSGFKDTVQKLARAKFPQDENAAALSIVGYPMGPEVVMPDNRVMQKCERCVLIWDGKAAAPFDVVFGLYGGQEAA